jgi:bifunctional UDP-N-acetylglucosamine pyrophosphorylase/glucosamine-1-phosphate N-acetyltransferase
VGSRRQALMSAESGKPDAIILAAGKGTRMAGDLPKVVHAVGGRPMVCAVVDACRDAGCARIIVVVGYRQELVRGALGEYPGVEYAVQDQQLGTGHAVLRAEGVLTNPERDRRAGPPAQKVQPSPSIFVLAGDGPLIRPQTLRMLLQKHRDAGAAATLATAVIDDPTGYGRIVRDRDGRFTAIVEHKNATPAQRQIREVNPSYYCFNRADLFGALKRVPKNPASGEYYLTDTLELLIREGKRVEVAPGVPPEDVLSINTPEELAKVDRIFRSRQDSKDSGLRTSPAGLAS